jgi:low affinity Fe/Cu permease
MKVGFKQRRGNVGLVVQILDAATVVVGVAMLQNILFLVKKRAKAQKKINYKFRRTFLGMQASDILLKEDSEAL